MKRTVLSLYILSLLLLCSCVASVGIAFCGEACHMDSDCNSGCNKCVNSVCVCPAESDACEITEKDFVCYNKTANRCCPHDSPQGTGALCGINSQCCDSFASLTCAEKGKQYCCPYGIIAAACTFDKLCCGTNYPVCYNPKTEQCCCDQDNGFSCPSDNTCNCTSNHCIPPGIPATPTPASPTPTPAPTPVPKTCKDVNCSADCCLDGRGGPQCYIPEKYKCIGNGDGKTYLCPIFYSICNSYCFDPINYDCCNGRVTEAGTCGCKDNQCIPTPAPTATTTPRPTTSPTVTARPTTSASPTARPTTSASPTPRTNATTTTSPTARPTATVKATITSTATRAPTSTATRIPTPTATRAPTPTATRAPTTTASPTATRAPTATATRVPTSTATHAPTATATRAPTATASRAPTATATRAPTATPTTAPTIPATATPTVPTNSCLFDPTLCSFGTNCTYDHGGYDCVPRYFYLRTKLNGFVVDINSTDAEAVLVMNPQRTPRDNRQVWSFVNGYFQNAANNYVFDIAGGKVEVGTPIINYPKKQDGSTNQEWQYDQDSLQIFNIAAPLVLDINGYNVAPGTGISLYIPKAPNDDRLNQQFVFDFF